MSDNIRMFIFDLDEESEQDLLRVVDQHLKSNGLPITLISRRVYLEWLEQTLETDSFCDSEEETMLMLVFVKRLKHALVQMASLN